MTAPSSAPPCARVPAHPRRTGSLITGPSRATSTPVATWAAAGANTSRPWKVRLTAGSRYSGAASSNARQPVPDRNGVNTPLSGPTKTWSRAATAIPRRAVATPGSITATCTVPPGKNGAAASSASAPATTSWRETSWVTSTSCTARPAVRMIPRIAPFISATYGSRRPKSVVSVTMASNPFDRRPSAVPIHDEVRHERERLALLRRREDLEVGLRGPRVGVGPRARVLDALVLDDQPADLLELRRDQGRTREERADALRLRRYQPPEHRDQRECPLSLAQVRADDLAQTVLVRDEVERVVRDLERDPDVEPVTGERLDLVGRETAEQRADPAARGHERGRLLRDDAEVVGLRREAAPLALELEDLGFRHRHRGPRERLHHRAVVVAHEHRERLRVEVVADQERGVVAPLGVRRRPAAPERRLVDDVVVDEGRGVEQLDHAPEPHAPRTVIAGQARGEQQEDRAQPLAAGARDVPPHLLDERDRGVQLPVDLRLDRLEVLADQAGDALLEDLLECRGGHAATLLRDNAILDLDLRARRHRLKIGDRESLPDFGDTCDADFFVELAEHLTGHGVDERDLVAPQAHDGPRPDAVGRDEVDHDPRRVHVDDHPAPGHLGHGGGAVPRARGRGGRAGRCGRRARGAWRLRRRRRGLRRHALTRADLAAARRRTILGDDLRRGDERVLVDEPREREGDLVLLHPDVLRLARHIAEARVLDQEPAGLGGFDRDGRIAERRDAERLAHGGTAGERQDQREPQREAVLRAPAHNGP